jgi:hypothetical protein
MSPVPLTDLSLGSFARLQGSDLKAEDVALLQALGLTGNCRFKVCKTGDPWIVQVRETRIGLVGSIAGRLLAVPEPAD